MSHGFQHSFTAVRRIHPGGLCGGLPAARREDHLEAKCPAKKQTCSMGDLQDPKMELLYHIRPYFHIFSRDMDGYGDMLGTSILGSWNGHWHVGTGASIHLYGQKNWLVVDQPRTYPSEKWWGKVSWDYDIPNIWKSKKCSKPPTRIIRTMNIHMYACIYIYIHMFIYYIMIILNKDNSKNIDNNKIYRLLVLLFYDTNSCTIYITI